MCDHHDELYGMVLVRWFDRYLAATGDDHLLLLEGQITGGGPPGSENEMGRADWTRGCLGAKLTTLRRWFGGEPDTHRDFIPGQGGSRGRWEEVPVKQDVADRFNSLAAPQDSMWLNDYRRRVLAGLGERTETRDENTEHAENPL